MRYLFPSCLRRLGAPLFLLVLLTAAGCEKNADLQPTVLPTASETGSNSIGCMVDNRPWVVDAGSAGSLVTAAYMSGTALEVEATREDDSRLRLHLYAPSLQPGTYSLEQARLNFEDYDFEFGDKFAAGGAVGEGSVTLTKVLPVVATASSPAYTIVAGTFAFTAVSPLTGAVAHFTAGRFDVKAY